MVVVSPPNPESRQIAGYLAEFDRRISRVEAGLRTVQLGNSSLDGAGIAMYDSDGNYRGTVGFQDDGTTAMVSHNPQPPPVPAAPQVTPAMACLIVSHTGATQGGSSNPADFGHLNVYAAAASNPGERTLRGTINPVPGEFVLSGLDYVSYLVDVTAVNLGGKESSPSPAVAGTPQQVVGADIIDGALEDLALADGAVTEAKLAAGAVTSTKIADDSISSPKIIAGSIGASDIAVGSILAAHIVSRSITADKIIALSLTANEIAANAITAAKINAGAVTAIKLEADMVIANRIIAGTTTGARVEMHPTLGLQAFRSDGVRTFWIEAGTGSFSSIGSFATAFSGQRIVMNPNGTTPDTIRFYPNTGSTFASIDSVTLSGTAAIEMYSGSASGGRRGILIAREGFASLIHGTPDLTAIYGDIFVSGGGEGRVRSGRTDFMSDLDQHGDPGERHYTCHGITPIDDTTLYFRNSGFDEPELEAYWMDVGLTFSNHVTAGLNPRMYITGANNSGRRDAFIYSLLYVGDLVKQSSRELKSDIEVAQDLDPRQAVRNARAHYYTSPHYSEDALYDTRENSDGESSGRLIRPAREAPTGMLGLIAEDMPAEVTQMVSESLPGVDALGINTDRMITLMWQGQGDVNNRLDLLENSPHHIPEVTVLPSPPLTGATLYSFTGDLYAVLSSGKRVKLGS